MTNKTLRLVWLSAGLCGCVAAANLTPGATLLAGMQQYQEEMQSLAGSPTRWPERQQAAGALKTVALTALGGSREFLRMIDLDLRKREFDVTIRETNVRADRLQEMKDEIVKMNEEIASLKPIVKAQMSTVAIPGDGQQRIESIATRGLLELALDDFSANGARRERLTEVDHHVVTDLGTFAIVRAPDGRTFRCIAFNVPEEGGGIRCEAIK